MTVANLPTKFGAKIYIQSGVRHFSEIKHGGHCHLEIVGGSHGTTHEGLFFFEGLFVVRTPSKNFVMIS